MKMFLLLAVLPIAAEATQKGRIYVDGAEAHRWPDSETDEVHEFKQNEEVELSDETIKDKIGVNWFKVRLPDGRFGYLRANEVVTEGQDTENRRAKIDADAADSTLQGGWILVLRAMGVAGWTMRKVADTGQVVDGQEFGGEVELNFSALFWARGFWRRFISLGGVYSYFENDQVVSPELVFRIYTPVRVEPEIRLRLGMGLESKTYYPGGALGIRYPFSISSRVHVSYYFELGAMQAMDSAIKSHYYGATGLGLHL